ncbi:hypothetical protein Trydic_g20429, partial [Trypoxylus dichotomus]
MNVILCKEASGIVAKFRYGIVRGYRKDVRLRSNAQVEGSRSSDPNVKCLWAV